MQTARSMRLALIGIAALAGSAPVGTAIGQGTAQGSAQSPAARLALVIGNAGYTLAPALPACTASANMVAARLKAAGFDVAERLDASNGAMGAALTEFARALALHPGAAAVVYVCGYAVNLRDRDFVLPVSANLARPSDVLTEGVVARAFGTTAGGAQAGPGLVLLDLFALPTTVAAAPTGTLAQETTNGHLAIAVALEPPGPAAATPAATALAQALGETEVKLPGLIGHLQSLMPSGGTTFVGQQEATADLFLVGAPPPPPLAAPAAPAAAPAPAPTPAPVPPVAAEPAPAIPPATPSAVPALSAAPPQAAPPAAGGMTQTSAAPAASAQPPPALPAPAPAAAPAAPPSRPPLPDEATMTQANRRDVQIALARLGYYDRRIDGVIGPHTRAAIRRWQHDIGADMTGTLSGAQATWLVQQQ